MQSLDKKSAEFYKDLDDQLQAIRFPFVCTMVFSFPAQNVFAQCPAISIINTTGD